MPVEQDVSNQGQIPIAQSEGHSVDVVQHSQQCVLSSGYQECVSSQLPEQIVGQLGEIGACPSFVVQDQMWSGPNAPWQHYGQQPLPNPLELPSGQPFLVHPIYQEMPMFGHSVQEPNFDQSVFFDIEEPGENAFVEQSGYPQQSVCYDASSNEAFFDIHEPVLQHHALPGQNPLVQHGVVFGHESSDSMFVPEHVPQHAQHEASQYALINQSPLVQHGVMVDTAGSDGLFVQEHVPQQFDSQYALLDPSPLVQHGAMVDTAGSDGLFVQEHVSQQFASQYALTDQSTLVQHGVIVDNAGSDGLFVQEHVPQQLASQYALPDQSPLVQHGVMIDTTGSDGMFVPEHVPQHFASQFALPDQSPLVQHGVMVDNAGSDDMFVPEHVPQHFASQFALPDQSPLVQHGVMVDNAGSDDMFVQEHEAQYFASQYALPDQSPLVQHSVMIDGAGSDSLFVQEHVSQHFAALPDQSPLVQHGVMIENAGSGDMFVPGHVSQQEASPYAVPYQNPLVQDGSNTVSPELFSPHPQWLEHPEPMPSAEGVALNVHQLPGAFTLATLPNNSPAKPSDVVATREATPSSITKSIVAGTMVAKSGTKPSALVTPAHAQDLPHQVAVVKLDTGATLTAKVCKENIEWEWARAVEFMGAKSTKNHWYLNKTDLFQQEFREAHISWSQFKYMGKDVDASLQGHHAFESGAFMLMMLLVSLNRRFHPSVKAAALGLACNLLRVGAAAMANVGNMSIAVLIYGGNKQYHPVTITLQEGCTLAGMAAILSLSPPASRAWTALIAHAWCGYKIRSQVEHATLFDAVLFAMFIKNSQNKKFKNAWNYVGQFLWPQLLWLCSRTLDALACQKAALPLEQVPLLKCQSGTTRKRKAPWINKMILLQKMRTMKHHRKSGMQTHGDLVTHSDQLVLSENLVTTGQYLVNAQQAFSNVRHLTIHWDPASYDCSTLVAVAYSHEKGVACIPPIQNITPLLKKDVCSEIQELAAGKNQLTRMDGYTELRAVSHCLKGIGLPLEKFVLDPAIQWKAIAQGKHRILKDGKIYIVDEETGKIEPVLPPCFHISQTYLLCSISDQGGINRASLDYCQFKLGMPLLVLYDPFHRCWNDLKETLKKTKKNLFKTLIAFARIWNCNFGPMGSKEWFNKKRQRLSDMMHLGGS